MIMRGDDRRSFLGLGSRKLLWMLHAVAVAVRDQGPGTGIGAGVGSGEYGELLTTYMLYLVDGIEYIVRWLARYWECSMYRRCIG
jgi:hypothetical protein